ncbi:MAG: RDD family protein [Sulfurospirillaceae bacterium]|nr:RDD family protein [Sulfurospirillaceae bacterium]MDD3463138.1 RDD family protein [Sulfurospirillaceae bacterium]
MRWRETKKGTSSKKDKHSFLPIEYATVKQRLKAFITDSFMILMPILYIVFYVIMGSREVFEAHKLSGWLYILLSYYLITTLFYTFKSQTPGYKSYGLKLVDVSSLQKPSFFQITTRYAIFIFSCAIFPLLFVSLLKKNRQSLWDTLSKTAVILEK